MGGHRWAKIIFDRIAITIPAELGTPDGMCIDENGMLWIAQWNGFGVYRYPDSGSVYIVNPGVRGVPRNLFGNL